MTIIITDPEPDIRLTSEEYNKYLQEYADSFSIYAGPRPTFEAWVRKKLKLNEGKDAPRLLNESTSR